MVAVVVTVVEKVVRVDVEVLVMVNVDRTIWVTTVDVEVMRDAGLVNVAVLVWIMVVVVPATGSMKMAEAVIVLKADMTVIVVDPLVDVVKVSVVM